MKTVNVYFYENNGRIVRVGSMSESSIELNLTDGLSYGVGDAVIDRHYVENGQLAEIPKKPDENHVFDYTSKTWVPDIAAATARAMAKRNQLLADGPDRVNPLWWAAMSLSEKAEVAEYRQALLNITDQAGYPLQIDWPPPPAVFSQ